MVKAEWGTKRLCLSCGARYYDLNKKPPECPKCGAVFEVVAPKGRKVKADRIKDTLLDMDGILGTAGKFDDDLGADDLGDDDPLGAEIDDLDLD